MINPIPNPRIARKTRIHVTSFKKAGMTPPIKYKMSPKINRSFLANFFDKKPTIVNVGNINKDDKVTIS
ncbi:hypothetical protein PghCCS26_41870 [Paenibacillus glycanilyticus]|uniref:Uncharacterized protein n=1 Tax=Paenibacillus glycanilyticus TaxID=126569 RepID=A0ABQ6NQI4_9BACL|nr:hypothetical protein PghCCS26_41870 [Paenibacillus glycanilyticus]